MSDTAISQTATAATSRADGVDWRIVVFFVALMAPLSFEVAGLRMTPLRILLLVTVIPLSIKLLQGKAGRIVATDWLMLSHALWIIIAITVIHGTERVPLAGITATELMGSYLLGRILIRTPADFRRFISYGLIAMLVLLPLAVIEALTGRILVAEMIRPFFDTITRASSTHPRMGLERVLAVFEHPILFGLICSSFLANALAVFYRWPVRRWLFGSFAAGMTFLSLSSAPLLCIGMQTILMTWNEITKGAWKTLFVLALCFGFVIEMASNRSLVTLLIGELTMNPATGWIRLATFEYASLVVRDNPLFGIGFNDWPRPVWLTPSIDNFWLALTLRHGYLGLITMAGAVAVHFLAVMFRKLKTPDFRAYRIGYLVVLFSMVFVLCTVHIWGAGFSFVMFYLGAGGWFYTADEATGDDDKEPQSSATACPTNRYTRFAPHVTRRTTGDQS